MSLRFEVVEDDIWATSVAKRLEAAVGPGVRLCLATGATPAPVYQATHDLSGAPVYLLDEYGGLPAGDPGRCESMIRRHLLDHLRTDSALHVPEVDDPDPVAAADRYRQLISDGIDLAIVGLGLNGHVGMNEPGSSERSMTRVVELDPVTARGADAYGATRTPGWGITVGIAELMAAHEVWLLVTGEHKREILRRVMSGEIGPDLPAGYLRRHRNATAIVDRSAWGQSEPPGRIEDEHLLDD